ncbi:hypothetical protein ABZ312_19875 [Streptomyces sp. NPDC006207]
MIPVLAPGFLSWDEADPTRHPFDSASAAQVVPSLGPAGRVPRRPDVASANPAVSAWSRGEGKLWADAMSHVLVERYGRWAVGWRWAHDEGDFDGGPVGNWCCPRHSITTPDETLARVVAALCEWRGWLESLAGWFEAYPLDLAAVEDQRILWERAARNLILQVTDRTGCGSGWHGHCEQVLIWFLSRWGVATDAAQELVDQAIGGRFKSWTGPDMVLVEDIAERIALSLRPNDGVDPAGPAPDHLQRWLEVRETVAWQKAPDGVTPTARSFPPATARRRTSAPSAGRRQGKPASPPVRAGDQVHRRDQGSRRAERIRSAMRVGATAAGATARRLCDTD